MQKWLLPPKHVRDELVELHVMRFPKFIQILMHTIYTYILAMFMFPTVTIIRCLVIEKKRGILNKNPSDFQKTLTCYLGTTYLQHQNTSSKKDTSQRNGPKKDQGFYQAGINRRFGVSSYASHTSLKAGLKKPGFGRFLEVDSPRRTGSRCFQVGWTL